MRKGIVAEVSIVSDEGAWMIAPADAVHCSGTAYLWKRKEPWLNSLRALESREGATLLGTRGCRARAVNIGLTALARQVFRFDGVDLKERQVVLRHKMVADVHSGRDCVSLERTLGLHRSTERLQLEF